VMEEECVSQRDFVQSYLDSGFSYSDACKAYRVFCRVIEDAVVQGQKVKIGKVGAIVPVIRPSRSVNMSFQRQKKGVVNKVTTQYLLGKRLSWKFRVFNSFKRTHQLDDWLKKR
jgi:nucleoid DNA-binding protein